jgi:hypothetical protein
MLVDVQEKRRWLRRKTVTPAGLNMQLVKMANGLAIAYDQRVHAAAFCFANGPANCTVEMSDQLFRWAAQIECVLVKLGSRTRGELKGSSTSYFEISPTSFSREANELVCYKRPCFRIKDERFAHVAKRKTNAAAAGKRTAHFHQRNQRRQSAPVGKLKIKRPVTVRLVEDLCPGTGVKTTGTAMQGNKMIPAPLVNRIKNPHP